MTTTFGDLRSVLGAPRFWGSLFRLSVAAALGIAILFVVLTAFVVVLPVMLAGGLALHLYLRRKLRMARESHPYSRPESRGPHGPIVIEGEYTVVDKRGR